MPSITYGNKSDGDTFTSSDANEIKNVVNAKGDGITTRTFVNTLTFNTNFRMVSTQVGDINFTVTSGGNVDGVTGKIVLTGDSTGTVTFPSSWVSKNGVDFDNTKVNIIELEYESNVFYSVFN